MTLKKKIAEKLLKRKELKAKLLQFMDAYFHHVYLDIFAISDLMLQIGQNLVRLFLKNDYIGK